jgi:hypothetical protein
MYKDTGENTKTCSGKIKIYRCIGTFIIELTAVPVSIASVGVVATKIKDTCCSVGEWIIKCCIACSQSCVLVAQKDAFLNCVCCLQMTFQWRRSRRDINPRGVRAWHHT